MVLLLLVAISVSTTAFAQTTSAPISTPRECFRNHMREAMHLNRTRRPLYNELSLWKSTPISNRLIFLEGLIKTTSYVYHNYDSLARPYQEAGINIVCDEYIEMKNAPAFRETFAEGAPKLENYEPQDASAIKTSLIRALDEGGFEGVYRAAGAIAERLEREPRFNCLLRHTLDSVARIAWLAPGHVRAAKAKGLPSTASLSDMMIRDHLVLLSQIVDLDRKAAEVQAMNIPIICQDVPLIPWK